MAARLNVLTRNSPTNRIATQPEYGIVFSRRQSMLPPPLHSISMPSEIRGRVLPSRSRQRLSLGVTPFASLPGPQVRRACDRAREIWRAPSVARNIQVPSKDGPSVKRIGRVAPGPRRRWFRPSAPVSLVSPRPVRPPVPRECRALPSALLYDRLAGVQAGFRGSWIALHRPLRR